MMSVLWLDCRNPAKERPSKKPLMVLFFRISHSKGEQMHQLSFLFYGA